MAWQTVCVMTVCRLCVMLVLTRTEPHALNAPQTSLHQAGVTAWQTVCLILFGGEDIDCTRSSQYNQIPEPHALDVPQASLHQAGVSAWHIGLKKYWTARLDVLLIHIRYLTPKDSLALHAHQTLDRHRGVNPYWSVRVMLVSPKSGKFVYRELNAPQASLYQAGVMAWQTVCVMLVFTRTETIAVNVLKTQIH